MTMVFTVMTVVLLNIHNNITYSQSYTIHYCYCELCCKIYFNIALLKLIYYGIQNASIMLSAELFLTLK